MLLAVDVGNTRIKYAVFDHNTTIDTGIFAVTEAQCKVQKLLLAYPEIERLAVASVGKIGPEFFYPFAPALQLHFVTHQDLFPFESRYATPATLGIDRIVLAAGATLMYPGRNRLVIDAGTCITYDFVNENDQYLGGAISPGMRLRYEAMHHYTAKLPLLSLENPRDFIGDSTSQSMHSGVVHGVLHEIDGFIEAYRERHANFIIILTGGDTDFLAKRLKNTIFAHSNFLLESLNQTIQYQIKNV